MQELLKKSNPDYTKLKRYIITSAAKELSGLSQPCYYPKTKKPYYDILDILQIKDKDFRSFVKRNYEDTKAKNWNLWVDPGTNLLVFVMHLFLMKNDKSAYSTTMVYYMIFQYSKLVHKQIQYCNPELFKAALDTITKTHLFAREKTISNSLYYLSREVQNRYTPYIKDWDKDGIIAFIGVARHRISQSVKSFAENYYSKSKEKAGIKVQQEPDKDNPNVYQYQIAQHGQKIIDNVLKSITIYKVVDKKAMEEAKDITKIKSFLSTMISNELSKEIYTEKIKVALQLFIKEINDVNMICGKEFYEYVKRLMSLKRTTAQIYFKAQINILILDIMKNLNLMDSYNSYTPQTQFIVNSYLAFYLALMVKNKIC